MSETRRRPSDVAGLLREIPRKVIVVPPAPSLPDEERAEIASELVDCINRVSRQKKGGLFDVQIVGEESSCPLCELDCTCLGPSCLQKKGAKLFRMIF